MQQAYGVHFGIVGTEGIGADEFGKTRSAMRRSRAHRPHLMQHDGDAARSKLKRRFAPCEAAANNVHGL
jgi:hypothetical protein